jgi:hypothetical protein
VGEPDKGEREKGRAARFHWGVDFRLRGTLLGVIWDDE